MRQQRIFSGEPVVHWEVYMMRLEQAAKASPRRSAIMSVEWESSTWFGGRKKRLFTVTAHLLSRDELLRYASALDKATPTHLLSREDILRYASGLEMHPSHEAKGYREYAEHYLDDVYMGRFSGDVPDTFKKESFLRRDGQDYLMRPLPLQALMNTLYLDLHIGGLGMGGHGLYNIGGSPNHNRPDLEVWLPA